MFDFEILEGVLEIGPSRWGLQEKVGKNDNFLCQKDHFACVSMFL